MRSIKLFGLLAVAALALAAGNKAMAQDAEAGGKVFKQQCMACHSPLVGKNLIGPSLFGVVDRPAGSIPNFHYSAANKGSGITWNTATLDRYLKAPKEVVPGTIMPYAGLKNDAQRADLIGYLATLK
jgi:cytochrome c